MNKFLIFQVVLAIALVATLTACGPMNSEKKSNVDSDNPVKSLKTVSTTKNNLFYVHIKPQQESSAGLEMGDNNYIIHVVSSKDLGGLSDKAKITISYSMPDMPAMGQSDADVTKQNDGTYLTTIFYSMLGKWEIIVSIQDGDLQDTYVFETKL